LTLLCILLFFAPLVSQIPLAALAAVLIMVSWHMSEIEHFIHLFKAPVGDRLILLTTFFLTIFVDLTAALFIGMTLACFVFMKQMSQSSKASCFFPQEQEGPEKDELKDLTSDKIPPGVEIYAIQGPLFFGSTYLLKDLPSPQIFILDLEHVPMIDASGLFAIQELHGNCQKKHTRLFLSGVRSPIKKDLKKLGLLEVLKDENIFPTLSSAVKHAKTLCNSL
jgi:SulP family sulfate permease